MFSLILGIITLLFGGGGLALSIATKSGPMFYGIAIGLMVLGIGLIIFGIISKYKRSQRDIYSEALTSFTEKSNSEEVVIKTPAPKKTTNAGVVKKPKSNQGELPIKETPSNYSNLDINTLIEKANKGDVRSQLELGYRYQNGIGVKMSYEKAFYWLKKAADKGDAFAEVKIGMMYRYGKGVKQSYSTAVYWFRRSANQGHHFGQCALGLCYSTGKGVIENDKTALYWYKKAADQELPIAERIMGQCYENGWGVKKSISQAKYWYKRAVEHGFTVARDDLRKLG